MTFTSLEITAFFFSTCRIWKWQSWFQCLIKSSLGQESILCLTEMSICKEHATTVLPASSPTPYDIVRPSYDITATAQLTMNNMVSSTLLVGAYCRWNKCVATKCIGHTQLGWVQTVLLVWRFKRPLSVWATSTPPVSVLVRLLHLCTWCSEWEVLAVEVSELCSELPQKCWEGWLQR